MKKNHLSELTIDIFADLGLKNAEELKARSDLISEVFRMIRKSKLSQKKVAYDWKNQRL